MTFTHVFLNSIASKPKKRFQKHQSSHFWFSYDLENKLSADVGGDGAKAETQHGEPEELFFTARSRPRLADAKRNWEQQQSAYFHFCERQADSTCSCHLTKKSFKSFSLRFSMKILPDGGRFQQLWSK